MEHFVYILRSKKNSERLYVGLTRDISGRLSEHNSCQSTYSKTYAPWELEAYISVKSNKTAKDLEQYLKSGSGFAFMKKRLLPSKDY